MLDAGIIAWHALAEMSETRQLQAIESLHALRPHYRALLCDVWGVVHNGREAFREACAALSRFRASGGVVVLLTNAPRPRGVIPAQLDRLGVPRSAWDVVVTSGDATRALLGARAPGPMLRIGPPQDAALWEGLGLQESGVEEARFVAVSGLVDDRTETPADYAETLRLARARNLPLICANPDIVVRMGDRLIYCAGALAQAYEALGGEVLMSGKPHAPIYDIAFAELERLAPGLARAQVLAIGDGVSTDLAGAAAQGLDALFVAAGVHGESLLREGVLDLAAARQALAQQAATARFGIAVLR